MEEFNLIVPSIGCQGCLKKIVNQLQTLAGVEVVQTDVSTKSLLLRYAAQEISVEQIEAAVRAVGHKPAPRVLDLTTNQA